VHHAFCTFRITSHDGFQHRSTDLHESDFNIFLCWRKSPSAGIKVSSLSESMERKLMVAIFAGIRSINLVRIGADCPDHGKTALT